MGVLEIHIPKGEAAKSRQIAIRGGREREMGGRVEPRVLEPGDGGRRDKEREREKGQANATVSRS